MKVEQVYDLMNTITTELTGDSTLVQEDLQNVVQLGETFENSVGLDNFVGALVDKVGKMIFKDKIYKGRVPKILMDSWEFGSMLQKVSMDKLPEAQENASWNLIDGQDYSPHKFYKTSITNKFWNDKITFDIPISITKMQVKSAFNNAVQLNSFISMLYNAVNNSLTVKLDALIMRTINNLIGTTIYTEYKETDGKLGDLTLKSGVKAINLLYLYNETQTTPLAVDNALLDKDFLRFASAEMSKYIDNLSVMSTLFNIDGKERFTHREDLHVVMLKDFKTKADMYLQSDVFHNELTELPLADYIPFWQGSGKAFDFEDVSKINIKTSNGKEVEADGILACFFDREACAVVNENNRTTSQFNPSAEFYNNWYKFDAGYFNDTSENFVVFFIA